MANVSSRPAAVAGMFYPADARVLRTQLGELLAGALPPELPAAPKVIVVPHAGYIYSGAVAASAYTALAGLERRIRRVVLLGPAHRVGFEGFALPAAHYFETPLGVVPLSRSDWLALKAHPKVTVDDHPHAREHCLEVQLPFLQVLLERFELVPLLVGQVAPAAVADMLEMLWGDAATLLVISSDLSHYHAYDFARQFDQATARQILALGHDLSHEQACGATPLNGLMQLARRRGLEPHLLDLRNSGDTAGDRSSVVGYASFAFTEPPVHGQPLLH